MKNYHKELFEQIPRYTEETARRKLVDNTGYILSGIYEFFDEYYYLSHPIMKVDWF